MNKNANANLAGRVIGFDSHPDTFTAALLQGPTPAAAVLEKMFNQVPMARLQSWAKKHTTPQDLFVLEASGNSFQVVRTLAAIERKALVLESCQMGKLKPIFDSLKSWTPDLERLAKTLNGLGTTFSGFLDFDHTFSRRVGGRATPAAMKALCASPITWLRKTNRLP